MIERQGTFVPYAYTRCESIDVGRYVIEKGLLTTPTGPSPYTIVRMRPFVCVLAVVNAGTCDARVLLVRQYRYAVDDWQLEPPAGGVDDGELPADAATRELREESGLVVDELVALGRVYPSGGSTSEVAYLFAARCAGERVRTDWDKGEQIETVLVSRAQMEELLNGAYEHAVTYAVWVRFASSGLLDAWMPLA